ncbi:hypothetical protein ACXR2T_14465 [Leucobacter sp. HY1910]
MKPIRIRVAFSIDCTADAAWNAMHSSSVAATLYRPLLQMQPTEHSFSAAFAPGTPADVRLLAFGRLPVGRQRILIEDITRDQLPPGSRTMRDYGRPLSGPLALTRGWNHELSVWPAGNSTAVWHDELTVAGIFAYPLSLALWPLWLWRKTKIRRLAHAWRRGATVTDR